MTMPSGSAGTDAPFNDFGQTNTLTDLATFSRGNIESHFTSIVQNNGPLGEASAQFFNIILGGFQTLTNLVDMIVQAITGAAGGGLSAISGFMSGIIGSITDVFTGLTNLISNLLHDPGAVLGAIPQALVSGLNGVVAGLSSGINSAVAFVQSVVDALLGALRGVPIIGGFVPNLSTAVLANQATAQNFTISALSSAGRNPTWACRYPVADITYPEFFNTYMVLAGNTGVQSAGTAHTHVFNTIDAFASTFGWIILQDQSNGGYITTQSTTVYDTVGVIVNKTSSGSINNVYLEVFREDASGGLMRLFSQDISASLTTTHSYYETSMPGVIAQAGERYVVRVRNSSTVVNTVEFIGIWQSTVSFDYSMETNTATDSVKTSITATEAAAFRAAADQLPFAVLAAKDIADPDVSYSDDFNRANLGPWWLTSGTGDIAIGGSEANYGGFSAGDQMALYIRRTTGDASRVDGNLYLNSAASSQRLGLILHGNRDLSEFIYLSVCGSDAKIYSFAAGVFTQRATVAVGGTEVYTLYYDLAADKYVALRGGQPFGLQWASVGGAVHHGSDFRFGGLQISCASSTPAGTIDNWTLRDWAPAPAFSVSPSGAALTLTGFAPRLGFAVVPGGASLSLTGAVPVRLSEILTPAGAVLTIAGSAPA